jgi:hypothetical protein
MVAVLALGRAFDQDRLDTAAASAVSHGACGMAAVRYLLAEGALVSTSGTILIVTDTVPCLSRQRCVLAVIEDGELRFDLH